MSPTSPESPTTMPSIDPRKIITPETQEINERLYALSVEIDQLEQQIGEIKRERNELCGRMQRMPSLNFIHVMRIINNRSFTTTQIDVLFPEEIRYGIAHDLVTTHTTGRCVLTKKGMEYLDNADR